MYSVQFSRSVVSDSLRPHELQRQASLSITNSQSPPKPMSLSWWCHPIISSSVVPFSSCPQSFRASGSFQMSQFFASGGQSTGKILKDISSVQFSRWVMSDSLWPHELQHTRPPCPSPTPRVYSNSCPSSWWCHLAISFSVVPFSSCPNPSQHQDLFQWVNSSHKVAKVLEFQLQHQSFQWTPRTYLLGNWDFILQGNSFWRNFKQENEMMTFTNNRWTVTNWLQETSHIIRLFSNLGNKEIWLELWCLGREKE